MNFRRFTGFSTAFVENNRAALAVVSSIMKAEIVVAASPVVPLRPAAVLGLFRDVLESSLVDRGIAHGLELLGSAEEFWHDVDVAELRRMAEGGNAGAQAELAWRYAMAEGLERSYFDAQRWAARSAEAGCPSGEAILGWLLYHGHGLPRDPVEAARLFRSAAEHGQPQAIDLLARCYFFGRGVAQDKAEAVRLWREAAQLKVASARFSLALCLYSGDGVTRDRSEAIPWFEAAAEQQVVGAAFMLGQCYMFGFGVPVDTRKAVAWYRRAAEHGHREAQFELAEALAAGRSDRSNAGECKVGECRADAAPDDATPDLAEALRWWRAAARQDHGRACLKIAHCHRWGDGVPENKPLALAWYRRAAKLGEVSAEVWLGECLELGEGCPEDVQGAAAHYRCAADAGDAHGQAEFGRCLLHGIGVARDAVAAELQLRAAAEGGWTSALGELERYWFAEGERLMQAAAGDPIRALACYRKAADLGHRRAAYALAECLRYGIGGRRDLPQALRWYRKAASLFDAKIALADMYFYGWGVPSNAREALRWYEQAVAQQQDAYAMYSLGYCLLHGQGTERDVEAGIGWLEQAALLGEVDAQYELGSAYLRSSTVKLSRRGTGRGADQGVVQESEQVADALDNGAGQQALDWLTSAAQHGHAQALAFLERVQQAGPLN